MNHSFSKITVSAVFNIFEIKLSISWVKKVLGNQQNCNGKNHNFTYR